MNTDKPTIGKLLMDALEVGHLRVCSVDIRIAVDEIATAKIEFYPEQSSLERSVKVLRGLEWNENPFSILKQFDEWFDFEASKKAIA